METGMSQRTGISELSDHELDKVSGGIAPVLGLAVATVGHFTARSFVTGIAARIGLGQAVFEAAKAAGGHNNGGKASGGGGSGGAGAGQSTRMTVIRL